jgi:hypothetical protein
MKRIVYLSLVAAFLAYGMATLASAQESLGDYARAVRKDKAKDTDKKPTSAKRYDNDNLPANDKLSVVGTAPAEPANSASSQGSDPNAASDASGKQATDNTKQSDGTAEARKQALEQWKEKLAKQKELVDLAARELDVVQREYRLRAAAFYSDAGNRLRAPGGWDQEDGKFKQQVDEKQKALDSAKQKLSDMQEDARKSGVPSSARE